jgi:hypothetical protein
MTKHELITNYLNAQSQEEIVKYFELMDEAIRNATPEVKETLEAVVSAKKQMEIKKANDLIAEIDRRYKK